jgi:hypothetical protein
LLRGSGGASEESTMKPSRSDHDDAITAFAAIRSSCCGLPEERCDRDFKVSLLHDLEALNNVVVAYHCEQRISRAAYGDYMRALARWLDDARVPMEV